MVSTGLKSSVVDQGLHILEWSRLNLGKKSCDLDTNALNQGPDRQDLLR